LKLYDGDREIKAVSEIVGKVDIRGVLGDGNEKSNLLRKERRGTIQRGSV
jgi:hypothetical protein